MLYRYIILHHSAGPDSSVKNWDQIRRTHLANGWIDIGYNWGIEDVGGFPTLQVGRPMTLPGAHCPTDDMNRKAIGVCMVGNFELRPPRLELLSVLAGLCVQLCNQFGIPTDNIHGHNAHKNTLCPGRQFPVQYIRDLVSRGLQKIGE